MLTKNKLDKTTPIPLYFQLEKLILEEIENGTYPVDSMIPTEKELSQLFDISRTTVRQAIADLVREGRLYRVKSKGTFVMQPKISQGFIQNIQSFNEDVIKAGGAPRTEVLDFKVVKLPDKIAFEASSSPNAKAIYLYRKRYADDVPIVRVETYLSYDLCNFVFGHDLSTESLYQVLSANPNTHVTHVIRSCEAHLANASDVSVLGMKRGDPIHYFVTKGYNQNGELIEYSVARYRGDSSKFSVELYR